MATEAPVLVLGLGNDVLCDDAVGLRVAGEARVRLAGRAGVEVRATTEMGLALLDEIAGRQAVVVVDAVRTGRAPPGHVHEFGGETLAGGSASTPHFLGLGETLSFGRMLGLPMPSHVHIVAVEVADPFTLGTALTPAVEQAVPGAADRVVAWVEARLGAVRLAPGP
jgi:hydrogenase maturation protease